MVHAQDAIPAKKRSGKIETSHVVVNGVKYPMLRNPQSLNWRVRKRTKTIKVDYSTGVSDLKIAKEKAIEELSKDSRERGRKLSGSISLRELCDIYERMPKRANEDTAHDNVNRLARIVKDAWGRELREVRVSEVSPKLWEDYAKSRSNGKLDISTRKPAHRGINAAIRMAVSIFSPSLELSYKDEGIKVDLEGISKVRWLRETKVKIQPLKEENLKALHESLPLLKESNYPMWRAISIARYSGLRSGEISAAHKNWLIQKRSGIWGFAVHDRPEQEYLHKTGEDYFAPITNQELLDDLLQGPDGLLIDLSEQPSGPKVRTSRDRFFRNHCNNWLRRFIPKPHKGMHRLRALCLEEIKDARAAEIMAEREGIKAAKDAAGHTSTKTTETHYLPSI